MNTASDLPRIGIVISALVLGVHGLIHLMGATVYLRLADLQGLAYKTTILGGRIDLGEGGTRIFGALWIVPAVAFVIAALALLEGWGWWSVALLLATLLSIPLTLLDWNVAFMGAIVDFLILIVLWVQLRIVPS
jgi:hypothetical protein